MGIIKQLCVVAIMLSMFVGVSFACDCSVPSDTGKDIYLTKTSVGDPIVEFTLNEPESGIPLTEVTNPITYHQDNVNFEKYYSKNEVNGPCDRWATNE